MVFKVRNYLDTVLFCNSLILSPVFVLLAILPMFLKFKLDYNEDTSTVIFHAFIGLFGFFSILGGVLADQYIGKFKAILWTSLVYLIGLLMFPLISIQQFSLPER